MLIVADTSPLNYLILIESESVLPTLYKSILIPPQVLDELKSQGADESVKRWVTTPPEWLVVQAPKSIDTSLPIDPGESAAIALAREVNADRLLMDDRDGRAIAESLGLRVAGTLAVLRDAATEGLIDLRDAVGRLRRTTFRASPILYQQLLDESEDVTGV